MPNSIVEDDATTRDANVRVTTISSTGSSQLSSSSGQVSTFGTANQEENIPDVTPSPPGARTLFNAPTEDERRTNFLSAETPEEVRIPTGSVTSRSTSSPNGKVGDEMIDYMNRVMQEFMDELMEGPQVEMSRSLRRILLNSFKATASQIAHLQIHSITSLEVLTARFGVDDPTSARCVRHFCQSIQEYPVGGRDFPASV